MNDLMNAFWAFLLLGGLIIVIMVLSVTFVKFDFDYEYLRVLIVGSAMVALGRFNLRRDGW